MGGAGGSGVGCGAGGAPAADWETLNETPAIVSVPLRAGPAFAATSKLTLPLPRPVDDDERTVIQGAADTTLQVQRLLDACTWTIRPPPSAPKDAARSAGSTRQGAAACDISVRSPLATIAPVRVTGSVFAEARYWSVPSPWPLFPDVMLNHPLSAVALHWHSRSVRTLTAPVPPSAGT